MSHELYGALSGALATLRELEVVSHNVANASTDGFRAGRVRFTMDEAPGGHTGGFARLAEVRPVPGDGPLVHTGSPTDLALRGPGYFAVDGGDGRVLLTRDGRASLDADGVLVTGGGQPLLGLGGPIYVPDGASLHVTEDGRVMADDLELDVLQRLDGAARHAGGNMWEPTGALTEIEAPVLQGAIEASNVDPMHEMVALVEASRMFEAVQKAMQATDEMDAKLNRIGGG